MIALGISSQVLAQDEMDALRYSRLTTGGTARTQAIGGAAGSLGGDITASHVNPAGLGFFRTSEFVLTPGFYFRSNDYVYRGTASDQQKSGAMLSNAGFVFGLPASNQASGWRNVAFAISYNRLADYNNNLYVRGHNEENSYTEKFLEELIANGVDNIDDAASMFPLGTSLAFNTYLIDEERGPGGELIAYHTRANPFNGGLLQQDKVNEKGGLNEFSIGVGANYSDKLYLGMSLNIPTLRYERTRVYGETDESDDTENEFDFFEHTDRLNTEGIGFNAKLGAIYSPTPSIRLGAALHTPTWYSMRDVSTATILVNTENFQPDGNSERFQDTEDLLNGYPVEYEYTLQTPLRALISASYIFGTNADVSQQHGFITADAEYVNYGSNKFRFNKGSESERDLASGLNNSIADQYRGTLNVRVGGELKFTVLAVRAGFAYYGDPYENATVNANMMKYSGGFGYRNRGFFADLTYVHTTMKDEYYTYKLVESSGPITPASVQSSGGNILLTLGFKF